jgi:hypothetical protein
MNHHSLHHKVWRGKLEGLHRNIGAMVEGEVYSNGHGVVER